MTAGPRLTAVPLNDRPDLPLLVLGPSLGTSAHSLWAGCAELLAGDFHLVGWELPGHGVDRRPPEGKSLTIAELAGAVLELADRELAVRGQEGAAFAYSGDSVGGAVGLRLLLDAPDRIAAAALLCTGAKIGDPQAWRDRAAAVRAGGTAVLLAATPERWFSAGFTEREPAVAAGLLGALADADAEGYAQVCEALAGFDVRDRLPEIAAPVLAIAGVDDRVTTAADLRQIARGVRAGRLELLDEVAHLAPAEAPADVARLLREHLAPPVPTLRSVYADGMAVRRAVLGDAHVDRALAAATDLTRDFQEFITRYAWGTVWTRPGLDRRSRSLVTLAALVARGHHEELAMHVRGARTNGVTDEEIRELLLQTAIYCGVPDANTAFRIAQRTLAELDGEA